MENITATFRSSFCPDENIVLYGLSENTRKILEGCPEYKILGLLDGYENHGSIYHKKILNLNDLHGPDLKIVIIARRASGKIIFNRIGNYCMEHQIPVFTPDGQIYSAESGPFPETQSCLPPDKNVLFSEIEKHDYISFDIFDTLLIRKVNDPTAVFRLVESKMEPCFPLFAAERERAEHMLSRTGVPALAEIYTEVKRRTHISDEQMSAYMQCELLTENSLLVARKDVSDALSFAKTAGKHVTLLSDMYIPAALLTWLLQEHGISDFDSIFVSCEYGTDKMGRLFDIYLASCGKGTYLHIGDNPEADIQPAVLRGIDVFPVKSPEDMLTISPCRRLRTGAVLPLRELELGLFSARAFQSPYALNNNQGKLKIWTAYDYGYLILAPVLAEFTEWLIRELTAGQYDRIFFISRDGYLMKRLYDLAYTQIRADLRRRLPESEYLLISRTAGTASCIATPEEFWQACSMPFAGSPEEILEKRFFLDQSAILKYDEKQSKKEYFISHWNAVRLKSEMLRRHFALYLKGLKLNSQKNYALFDFVSTGTCQLCLEKITGIQFRGFYFDRPVCESPEKNQLNIKGYMRSSLPEDNPWEADYFRMEDIIKEPSPGIRSFDRNGMPVYGKEYRDKTHIDGILKAQQAILDYMDDYLKLRPAFPGQAGCGLQILQSAEEEMNFDIPEFRGKEIMDAFCNRKIRLF